MASCVFGLSFSITHTRRLALLQLLAHLAQPRRVLLVTPAAVATAHAAARLVLPADPSLQGAGEDADDASPQSPSLSSAALAA